jgi:hypothetical protein
VLTEITFSHERGTIFGFRSAVQSALLSHLIWLALMRQLRSLGGGSSGPTSLQSASGSSSFSQLVEKQVSSASDSVTRRAVGDLEGLHDAPQPKKNIRRRSSYSPVRQEVGTGSLSARCICWGL